MLKRLLMGTLGAAGMLLTGCNGFFVDPNTTTTTTTGSSTADYAYVVNSNGTVSEFVIGSAVLTAISGSPFTPGTPLSAAESVAVNPTNAFVYVGGNGGILAYTIGSTGALAQISGGGVTEIANYVSLAVSPNGEYLLGLDDEKNLIYSFSINTSTGVLAEVTTYSLTVATTTALAQALAISPNADFVAVALGTAGDDVFTFNQTNGELSTSASSSVPQTSGYSDDSVIFDPTSAFLLIGRGGPSSGESVIVSTAVNSAGVVAATGNTYASGNDPFALLIDATSTYFYTANKPSGTISGYTLKSGALTALASSPYSGEVGVQALAEDINGKYVIGASSGGSADLTLYALDALNPGQLDPVATALNGTGAAGSIAVATTRPQ